MTFEEKERIAKTTVEPWYYPYDIVAFATAIKYVPSVDIYGDQVLEYVPDDWDKELADWLANDSSML